MTYRHSRFPSAPLVFWLALFLVADPAAASPSDLEAARSAPEGNAGATPALAVRTAVSRDFMVVTANDHATRSAAAILEAGGHAVDAAVAASLVLGLVEPQSSGLGGGGFALHFDAAAGRVDAYDGRETAPASAGPDLFLAADGTALSFWAAVTDPSRSTGVPGQVALLARLHRDHGRLPWPALFEPALDLARGGFSLSRRLNKLLQKDPFLRRDPEAFALYYTASGQAKPVGTRLVNREYAAVLEAIAAKGAAAFYQGRIAQALVAATRGTGKRPGGLRPEDLATYRARKQPALCAPYRKWRVCGPPPPAGGLVVLQLLGLQASAPGPVSTARGDRDDGLFATASALHHRTQLQRLAYADRNELLADPAFVPVPVAQLLDPAYLRRRVRRIDPARERGAIPPGLRHAALAGDPVDREQGTTHLSLVDRAGNAVSMTLSVENAFGSRRMVRGFLLNNQLTDFAFRPRRHGRPVANRPAAGKRPRSSMSPMMAFDEKGGLVLVTGSPGGSAIIAYVANSLIAGLDGTRPLAALVRQPHIINRNGATMLEIGGFSPALQDRLKAMGHRVEEKAMTSGLAVIRRRSDGVWHGAADPRREGTAQGGPGR